LRNLLVLEVEHVAFALLNEPLSSLFLRDFKRFRPVISLAVQPLLQETLCVLQLKLLFNHFEGGLPCESLGFLLRIHRINPPFRFGCPLEQHLSFHIVGILIEETLLAGEFLVDLADQMECLLRFVDVAGGGGQLVLLTHVFVVLGERAAVLGGYASIW